MTAPPPAPRRNFVAALGWCLGVAGVGGAGFALIQAAGSNGDDPRTRVDLPDNPLGFRRVIPVRGRPVAVVGLSPTQQSKLPSRLSRQGFVVVDCICTHDTCVVSAAAGGWQCPCCGSTYDIAGRRRAGDGAPAERDLAIPPHTFVGPNTLMVGSA